MSFVDWLHEGELPISRLHMGFPYAMDWNSASPACSILLEISEGPEDLSVNSFMIWVVSSSRVKGSMKRRWVFGVAVNSCACKEVWREEEISVASFSSHEESLRLKR